MTRDASTQTRTILVHLNVEVPEFDDRAPEEIVAALCGAITVGSTSRDCSHAVNLSTSCETIASARSISVARRERFSLTIACRSSML